VKTYSHNRAGDCAIRNRTKHSYQLSAEPDSLGSVFRSRKAGVRPARANDEELMCES